MTSVLRPALASAPGRCGIVGNPTDMYGGFVISVTIAERATCVVEPSDRTTVSFGAASAAIDGPSDLELRGDSLDVCRALVRHFGLGKRGAGLHLRLDTTIPFRAGLGGSSSPIVAAVAALGAASNRDMHPWFLAEEARKIESRALGVLCGYQDHHMAAFGGLNAMSFEGKEGLAQGPTEPLAHIESLARYVPRVPLVVAHTGVMHDSGAVHASPRSRWESGDQVVIDAYIEVSRLGRLGKEALLAGDWPALGELMNRNHRIVASLGGSSAANDHLIGAALAAGAYGAKLAGGGGGGTVVALARDLRSVARALRAAGAQTILFPRPVRGVVVRGERGPRRMAAEWCQVSPTTAA